MDGDQTSAAETLGQVNRWCLLRMTLLNRDILNKRTGAEAFRTEFGAEVLSRLPAPATLSPSQAQQLVVLLGLVGASVGRHYQEASEAHRATPAQAFAGLSVGAAQEPFGRYFARLADRTGTGHCHRDSYASLVRWNAPAVEVERDGRVLAVLPSIFEDGLVRTYTGAVDEQRFFGLLKASEALERAVNAELMPLSQGSVQLDGDEALQRVRRAVVLLDALRELNHDFADRPPGEGLQITHFMDVFRQFAVHWEPGDIPPSGALDAEALVRDLLVGIDLPGYPEHVRRVSPGLLDGERAVLKQLLERPSLPAAALELAGLAPGEIHTTSVPDLHRLVVRYPILAALHVLLNAHARVAGVHLLLSKRFLFDPQRARDQAGLGDPGVVSNRTGTTGMDEARLETFTRVRRHHALSPLRAITARVLEATARPQPAGAEPDGAGPAGATALLVRFTGTALPSRDLGLPDRLRVRPHRRADHLIISEQLEPELEPEPARPGRV